MSDYTATAATTIPLTVREAKSHLNVSSTADDSLIESYIKAATNLLETRYNRCFVKQTRTLKMDDFVDTRYIRNRRIYPPRSPLVNATSAQSVVYLDADGTSTTMPTTDYVWSTGDKPGFISESYNATWPTVYSQPNSVTVTYIAGHSSSSTGIGEHIKQALRHVVGTLYREREMSTADWSLVDAFMEQEAVETYG